MNQNQIDSIRLQLIQKKQSLQLSARQTATRLRVGDAACPDPFDHAAVEIHKDVELNCRHQEWHQLLDIQETLLRMERGFYGICGHCGRKISARRLQALPMTKYCVTCQAEMEGQGNTSRRASRRWRKAAGHNA